MWVASKATQFFCSKNINVYENTLAITVNVFVINELVNLTMLSATGPRSFTGHINVVGFFLWRVYKWRWKRKDFTECVFTIYYRLYLVF